MEGCSRASSESSLQAHHILETLTQYQAWNASRGSPSPSLVCIYKWRNLGPAKGRVCSRSHSKVVESLEQKKLRGGRKADKVEQSSIGAFAEAAFGAPHPQS